MCLYEIVCSYNGKRAEIDLIFQIELLLKN